MSCAIAELLTIGTGEDRPAHTTGDDLRVRALVDAAKAGDREAFGELVTLHERVVLRTARAALGTRHDAEDAAQDAFVMAWQKLPGFRGESTFRTWLLTITWRKALDRRRVRWLWHSRTQRRYEPGTALLEELSAADATPEQHTVSRDLAGRTGRAIARLSPKLRDTLLLAASGEHSYEEIAAMLKAPVGTIKWRVSEARRLVREKLEVRS